MTWGLALWLMAAPAGAGDLTAIDQIGPAPVQAPARTPEGRPMVPTGIAPSAATPQVNPGRRDLGPSPRVGPRALEARPAQLNTARATSDAPPNPAARPTRRTTVDTVRGDDRCDPAHRLASEEECARVIETRASEFAAQEPQTTAEERLASGLAKPGTQVSGVDARAAARRLASGDPGNSEAAQAIAVAGNTMAEPSIEQPKEPDLPDDASAAALILQSILQAVPR
ncbi:MAG: hypothetical protein IT546_12780 [Caulobacteraceae bacterium]|nr:hypothetical protein [Caulobacteraceae bacterium]